jgi:hypothetical protein
MSLQSTIGLAKLGTNSLRATVPEGIVAFLDLSIGDKLEWRMEVDKDTGERYAIVRKVRTLPSAEASKIAAKYVKTKRK